MGKLSNIRQSTKRGVLMPETNESLVLRIQSGEKDLIYELWSRNQPLIKQTVKQFECVQYPEEVDKKGKKSRNSDLMQESFLCLAESLPEYDQDRGKFTTFYFSRLKWWLIRVINASRGVSVPSAFASLQHRYNRYINGYYMEHGFYPDDNTVADALKMDHKTLQAVKGINLSVASLDVPIGYDSDTELWELIEDGSAAEIDDCVTALYNQELLRVWDSIDRVVTSREGEMLRLRFCKGLKLEKVGDRYGLTKERVRMIIDNALVKIRQNGICMKEITALGDGETRSYYLGGFGHYKNNRFTSSTEKRAIKNTEKYFERKQRNRIDKVEDTASLEAELIEFFGDVV